MRRRAVRGVVVVALVLVGGAAPAASEERPSLFRGIVVGDSPQGVQVISIEDQSQAGLAGVRAGDIIVKVDDKALRSIDDFAMASQALKGQAEIARIVLFRAGAPREVTLHLYSYPVLQEWGVAFIPAYDFRFADPTVGVDYWMKLGEGFERAGKPTEALRCDLNALHNLPTHVGAALKTSTLLSLVSRQHLASGRLSEGVAMLQQSLRVLQRLFDYPLSAEQLSVIRQQLAETLAALRHTRQTLERSSPN